MLTQKEFQKKEFQSNVKYRKAGLFRQGYQDIACLAGLVFIKRDFAAEVAERGAEAIFAECSHEDLTDDQRAVFEAAIHNPRLREVIELWWRTYDEERAAGEVPGTEDFWEP